MKPEVCTDEKRVDLTLKGKTSHVKTWDYELSASEIAEEYNKGTGIELEKQT